MKTLHVPDMHCQNCIARISKALSAAGITYEISLENKIVSVAEDKLAQAIQELNDLGFTPQE